MLDVQELRDRILPILLPYGVTRVAIFGSVARGDAGPESDIDILVDFEQPRPRPLGLFAWVGLEEELSKRLGRKVDLVSHKALNRHIRPYIEADAVTIYEQT